MDAEKLLKQLKRIKPDQDYTKRSRLLITGDSVPAGFPVFTVRAFIANLAKSGSAIALSAALLLMLLGSFSLWKLFVPGGTALIDPAGLRAEAQAIDIQIQLSNLAYREPDLTNETSSPAIVSNSNGTSADIAKQARAEAEQLGLVSPSSTATSSIDDALNELSR